jgi:hypothetical protein
MYQWLSTLDPARAQRLELEVAFDEFPNTLPDHNRARRGEGLQARGQADRMPDGRLFGIRVAGLDGSDHHLSAVDSHPNRQRRLPPARAGLQFSAFSGEMSEIHHVRKLRTDLLAAEGEQVRDGDGSILLIALGWTWVFSACWATL